MNRQRRRKPSEKIEIALERGQVTTLLVGSVVAMGLVFLLGVIFGSRLGATGHDVQIEDVLAKKSVSVAEEPVLTFHDALTSRNRQSSAEPPSGNGEARTASSDSPSDTPSLDRAVARVAASDSSSRLASSNRSDDNRTDGRIDSESPPQAEKSRQGFTVQVASSRDKKDTERLVRRLREAGWDAVMLPTDIDGRGRWYRVRVGNYQSREEAMQKQAQIHLAFNLSGLVVAVQ